jgi:hypothetical protein
VAVSGGCVTYPCDDDVLACGEGEAFEIDPSCEPQGPLSIEVLEMATGVPVAADAWPTVHHGPQGGIHFSLALRVTGMEPQHIALQLELDAVECADAQCRETTALAQRSLAADASLFEDEDDARVLPDVVVLLEREPEGGGELRIDVLDACGQQAETILRPLP